MRRVNPLILSTVSFAALASTPAFAQQTQTDKAPPQALTTEQAVKSGQPTPNCDVPPGTPLPPQCTPAVSGEAITVTGTRLRSPNLQSPLPVTSVGGQEFFQTGNVSIGDKLAELPQIASTFTQANSTRFLGTSGLNLLDLRGLGTARTLVLVNGRRHVGGDVLNTGVSVDVNTIPTDLIDRVDVVTGGNSAVYGSDAIAGVVNFVLKDHYQGIQLRAQGGESTYHDAGSYFISALAGTNFADGRGNVALNVEYARRKQAWGDDRDWLRKTLVQVDSDPAGTPNGSDGTPDRIINPDFRSATFNNTGLVRIGGPDAFGNPSGLACGLDPHTTQYRCTYVFEPNGTLVPQTGTRVGLGPNGQFIGGNGEGFFDDHQIQITPDLKRTNINLVGHLEASPGFVPFFEATFSKTKSTGTGANGPAFFSGSVLGDPMQFFVSNGNRERISLSNPFLDPAAAATIRDAILQSGINNCNFRPLTQTDINRLNAGTFRFCTQESMLGLGNRTEVAIRNTYRLVAGLRGDIGNNWNYEVSANLGALHETTKILGNLDVQRFLLAMDTVKDPATGNIVCASQINPGRAFGYYPWLYYQYGYTSPPADPNANARLANDIQQCTPINPLGGQFTDAQRAYLLEDTTAIGRTKQFDMTAFISGDTSKWFELPGGPVGIVLGAEYRSDNLYYHQAEDVQLGYTFYNAIPTFTAPASNVKEAFGELRLPILKDLPFANELEISGAARVSNYNLGETGTVWAYNGNAIYSPVEGVRLRGNYARAVRAPNQVELFTPFGQNFSLVTDPCDKNQVGNNQNRAANCAAAGIPAGTIIQYSSSLGFLSGGNTELAAEKSNSITLGGVLTPKFLPGFSASADYYNIKIKKAISAPSAQQIINACYDQPSLDNQYCALFERGDAGGNTGHNGQPYGIIDNSLHVQPLNFASLKARGIDIEVAYRHQFGAIGRLDTKLNWTHALELTVFQDPANPNFGNRLLSELGNPKDAFNWNSSFSHGPVTVGYQMRYIGKMVVDQYEDWFSFEGRPPQDADYADQTFYPVRIYHDVRASVDIGPKFNIYAGVDNLTNVKPPYALSGIGGGSAIYDAIGRFYYAGVVAKFR
jgi:outer membrane receptor protein involved in Fe transport